MKKISILLIAAAVIPALFIELNAQTSAYSLRGSLNIEMKIAKKLKFELEPEYRYNPCNHTSLLLVQAGLNYKIAPWLNIGGLYRLSGEKLQDSESVEGSSLDFSNRFAFDANTKLGLKRFTPKFRLRFCNFSDFDSDTEDKSNYLRYRFGLGYNIPGIKLAPFASVEFYQKLSSGLFSKSRYSIGAEYELNKNNAITAGYSFDDKYRTLTRYHIVEFTYKLRF